MQQYTPERHGEKRKSSADITRQLLKRREEEIDRRVADLKARLGGAGGGAGASSAAGGGGAASQRSPRTPNPTTPPRLRRTVSQSSDESCYQVNRSLLSKDSGSAYPRRTSSNPDGHITPVSDSSFNRSRSGASAYPTNRRINSIKKPSFVPTPNTKKKKTWASWFCPCHPGRRQNAAADAQAANARFERQRLLAEEGRLHSTNYGSGAEGPSPLAAGSASAPVRHQNSAASPYPQRQHSRRSIDVRTPGRLTPIQSQKSHTFNSSTSRY